MDLGRLPDLTTWQCYLTLHYALVLRLIIVLDNLNQPPIPAQDTKRVYDRHAEALPTEDRLTSDGVEGTKNIPSRIDRIVRDGWTSTRSPSIGLLLTSYVVSIRCYK